MMYATSVVCHDLKKLQVNICQSFCL